MDRFQDARRKRIRRYVQHEQAQPRPKTDEFSAVVSVMLGSVVPITAIGVMCAFAR